MKRIRSPFTAAACFAFGLATVPSLFAFGAAIDDRDVANAFLKHLEQSTVSAADQDAIRQQFAATDANPTDLVTEALMKLHPGYREAVQASDDDDLQAALTKLQPLTQSDDRFLAADASFYLSRTMMNHQRFEDALPLLQRLHAELADASAHASTVEYFMGQALAGSLENEAAIAAFMEFLQNHPDAPERLRVAAWRQVQDLQGIADGQMTDIYQKMDFSRRRLEIVESGDKTQTEQDKIVEMLAKLIKEQEKKECSSGNSKKDSKQQQKQQQQQQAQNQPKDSKSQSGGNSNNPNGQYVEKAYDTGNASPWSRLRDMSRDPANAAIKDKLPARYRDIVERYNDAVNGNKK